MLLSVVLLGRALEASARTKASDDLTALHSLLPEHAKVRLPSGNMQMVPIETLGPGSEIVVGPGDQLPVDGTVMSGSSMVNESALTGESIPVLKSEGATVIAGSINCDGNLRISATRVGPETTMARIVNLVELCQARAPSIQRIADKVAGKFSWGVLTAAGATAVFWSMLGPIVFPQVANVLVSNYQNLLLGTELACNVLVVSCPCALGLATPTAVLVGTSLAARCGLNIRGGDVLEAAGSIDTVVFDKTGTLTVGKPSVSRVVPAGGRYSQDDVLALAGTVEQQSTHPLGQAIVAACSAQGIAPRVLEDGSFREAIGRGAEGRVEGKLLEVGNKEWLHGRQSIVASIDTSAVPDQSLDGATFVHVRYDGMMIGMICITDAIRPEASEAVARLKGLGITHILMVSGDQKGACRSVATRVGIRPENVHWGASPSDKANIVTRLQSKGRKVAVVGDGVNDAAALAQADIGMAMSSGLFAAQNASDIVLSGNSATLVPDAVDLSRAIISKIHQNLFWAFGYNVIAIPVAAGVLLPSHGLMLTPAISGALMGLSSLAVVTNSLLLQQWKRHKDKA